MSGLIAEEKIRRVLDRVDDSKSKYPGMTYEQGVAEALLWVLGEIEDDEFTPAETES